MFISVLSFKGGCGKTCTAIHLAGALSETAPTLLVDGDLNQQGMEWSQPGLLPFEVVTEEDADRRSRGHTHVVIDTQARPSETDLAVLVRNSDLVVLPTTPSAPSLAALMRTWQAIEGVSKGDDFRRRCRVLITIAPPRPSRAADDARAGLLGAGLPVMQSQIRRLSCFERAADLGVLVKDVADPRAQFGWDDYVRVRAELLG
ncbi:MAG: ParA family protein [Armatimonadota bacterium]|nr:ParA family protein [Armatimonadota bacterium]